MFSGGRNSSPRVLGPILLATAVTSCTSGTLRSDLFDDVRHPRAWVLRERAATEIRPYAAAKQHYCNAQSEQLAPGNFHFDAPWLDSQAPQPESVPCRGTFNGGLVPHTWMAAMAGSGSFIP